MFFSDRRITACAVIMVCVFALCAQADFNPQRIYKIRQKVSLDAGWKFFRNNPTGTGNPYDTAFSDASWQAVNVPHSAMYMAPTEAGEASAMPGASTWTGISWYRKTFTVPAGNAHPESLSAIRRRDAEQSRVSQRQSYRRERRERIYPV